MPTISAWDSGAMATVRRRDLRPRPLSKSAQQLLAVATREPASGAALIERAGVRPSWGWPALTQLLERGLLETAGDGQLRRTSGRRRAA